MSGATTSACPKHPGVIAQYSCGRCRSLCCLNCCYTMPDGSICCSTCYSQPQAHAEVASTPSVSSYQAAPTTTAERGCPQHPLLPPVSFCKICGKGSCVTCDFYFPPNLHLCPQCVVSSQSALTPRRKKYMTTAFVMAAIASITAVVSISGALAGLVNSVASAVILGLGIIIVTTISTTVGTGVAWAALKKGGPNPMGIWIALIWNVLLLAVIVLMMVMYSLMRDR